ncbi:NlpC/P60 family protein [Streptomyces sp. NBC_00237]|uniref:NlpC/P60 family protein n=1 Tax=Streptomyces sp. NBC_00237 TaxID=2975687 RepID=UPI00224F8D39|nr:NlpC/P60 family protein [Streptomyces sp. NBC_00237]MCX5201727.1 NlpC/P60 family protein [Streptomyces sp. NBC_00237]
MASHRRPKQPSRTRVTVLSLAATAAVALTSQSANAAPKPDKKEVKAKVDALYEEAEGVTEKYNGAKVKQETLEKQVKNLQEKVARGQADLNELRKGLGSMATAQYRTGAVDPSLQLFLSSEPDQFLDRAAAMNQLTAKQAESLRKIQSKQRLLAQEREEASGKLADLSSVRKELGRQKTFITGKLGDAQKLLNTLTQAERDAMAEQDERASRSANERSQLGEVSPGSGIGAAAMAAARTKIGAPYDWGNKGPNAFDCSGLVYWAFKQVGRTVGGNTYAQVNDGPKIYNKSDLRPGDLVFFSGLSHVGFYAGNGMSLHAPKPGTNVRVEDMKYLGSFQYGVRVGG